MINLNLWRFASISFGILGAAILSATGPALAQSDAAPSGSPQNSPTQDGTPQQAMPNSSSDSPVNIVDQQFLTHVAQSDMTEIRTSQLALDRSQNPQVRQFAQMMIEQHTESSNQLKPLAAQKGVALPEYLGAENQSLLNQLTKLSGAEFDQAYINGQILAHATAQGLYQNQREQGTDLEIKAFADQFLPTIASHFQMVTTMVAGR